MVSVKIADTLAKRARPLLALTYGKQQQQQQQLKII